MYSKDFFQTRLLNLRTEQGLSMQKAADALGVPKSTYHNWESYDREPPYGTLCAIADLYGVTTDYLLGRTDER